MIDNELRSSFETLMDFISVSFMAIIHIYIIYEYDG